MTLSPFLPSEIARLVLGYLKEDGCDKTYRAFLRESPHLLEYCTLLNKGQEYPTHVHGKSLTVILDEYGTIKLQDMVRTPDASKGLWKKFDLVAAELKRVQTAFPDPAIQPVNQLTATTFTSFVRRQGARSKSSRAIKDNGSLYSSSFDQSMDLGSELGSPMHPTVFSSPLKVPPVVKKFVPTVDDTQLPQKITLQPVVKKCASTVDETPLPHTSAELSTSESSFVNSSTLHESCNHSTPVLLSPASHTSPHPIVLDASCLKFTKIRPTSPFSLDQCVNHLEKPGTRKLLKKVPKVPRKAQTRQEKEMMVAAIQTGVSQPLLLRGITAHYEEEGDSAQPTISGNESRHEVQNTSHPEQDVSIPAEHHSDPKTTPVKNSSGPAMELRTPVKSLISNEFNVGLHGISPKRKSRAPKRRSMDQKPSVISETLTKETTDSNSNSSSSQGFTIPVGELLLENSHLAEKLAESINKVKRVSDASLSSSRVAAQVHADGLIDITDSRPHMSRSGTITDAELDNILAESQMTDEAINSVIDMTKHDPEFDPLFKLFNVDKDTFLREQYGVERTAAMTAVDQSVDFITTISDPQPATLSSQPDIVMDTEEPVSTSGDITTALTPLRPSSVLSHHVSENSLGAIRSPQSPLVMSIGTVGCVLNQAPQFTYAGSPGSPHSPATFRPHSVGSPRSPATFRASMNSPHPLTPSFKGICAGSPRMPSGLVTAGACPSTPKPRLLPRNLAEPMSSPDIFDSPATRSLTDNSAMDILAQPLSLVAPMAQPLSLIAPMPEASIPEAPIPEAPIPEDPLPNPAGAVDEFCGNMVSVMMPDGTTKYASIMNTMTGNSSKELIVLTESNLNLAEEVPPVERIEEVVTSCISEAEFQVLLEKLSLTIQPRPGASPSPQPNMPPEELVLQIQDALEQNPAFQEKNPQLLSLLTKLRPPENLPMSPATTPKAKTTAAGRSNTGSRELSVLNQLIGEGIRTKQDPVTPKGRKSKKTPKKPTPKKPTPAGSVSRNTRSKKKSQLEVTQKLSPPNMKENENARSKEKTQLEVTQKVSPPKVKENENARSKKEAQLEVTQKISPPNVKKNENARSKKKAQLEVTQKISPPNVKENENVGELDEVDDKKKKRTKKIKQGLMTLDFFSSAGKDAKKCTWEGNWTVEGKRKHLGVPSKLSLGIMSSGSSPGLQRSESSSLLVRDTGFTQISPGGQATAVNAPSSQTKQVKAKKIAGSVKPRKKSSKEGLSVPKVKKAKAVSSVADGTIANKPKRKSKKAVLTETAEHSSVNLVPSNVKSQLPSINSLLSCAAGQARDLNFGSTLDLGTLSSISSISSVPVNSAPDGSARLVDQTLRLKGLACVSPRKTVSGIKMTVPSPHKRFSQHRQKELNRKRRGMLPGKQGPYIAASPRTEAEVAESLVALSTTPVKLPPSYLPWTVEEAADSSNVHESATKVYYVNTADDFVYASQTDTIRDAGTCLTSEIQQQDCSMEVCAAPETEAASLDTYHPDAQFQTIHTEIPSRGTNLILSSVAPPQTVTIQTSPCATSPILYPTTIIISPPAAVPLSGSTRLVLSPLPMEAAGQALCPTIGSENPSSLNEAIPQQPRSSEAEIPLQPLNEVTSPRPLDVTDVPLKVTTPKEPEAQQEIATPEKPEPLFVVTLKTPIPLETTTPEKPRLLNAASPKNPTPMESTTPEKPQPLNVATPKKPTPLETTTPEKPQPLNAAFPKNPTPLETTTPEKPPSLDAASPKNPTSFETTTPEKPPPLNAASPKNPTPMESTTPEKPQPLNVATPKKLTPLETTTPEKPQPLNAVSPKNPTPFETTIPEKPPPLDVASPKKPTPLETTTPEKPQPLNATPKKLFEVDTPEKPQPLNVAASSENIRPLTVASPEKTRLNLVASEKSNIVNVAAPEKPILNVTTPKKSCVLNMTSLKNSPLQMTALQKNPISVCVSPKRSMPLNALLAETEAQFSCGQKSGCDGATEEKTRCKTMLEFSDGCARTQPAPPFQTGAPHQRALPGSLNEQVIRLERVHHHSRRHSLVLSGTDMDVSSSSLGNSVGKTSMRSKRRHNTSVSSVKSSALPDIKTVVTGEVAGLERTVHLKPENTKTVVLSELKGHQSMSPPPLSLTLRNSTENRSGLEHGPDRSDVNGTASVNVCSDSSNRRVPDDTSEGGSSSVMGSPVNLAKEPNGTTSTGDPNANQNVTFSDQATLVSSSPRISLEADNPPFSKDTSVSVCTHKTTESECAETLAMSVINMDHSNHPSTFINSTASVENVSTINTISDADPSYAALPSAPNTISSDAVPSTPALPSAPNTISSDAVSSTPALPSAPNTISSGAVPSSHALPSEPNTFSSDAVPSTPALPSAPNTISSDAVPSTPALPSAPNTISSDAVPSSPALPSAPNIISSHAVPSFTALPSAPNTISSDAVPSSPALPSAPNTISSDAVPSSPALPSALQDETNLSKPGSKRKAEGPIVDGQVAKPKKRKKDARMTEKYMRRLAGLDVDSFLSRQYDK